MVILKHIALWSHCWSSGYFCSLSLFSSQMHSKHTTNKTLMTFLMFQRLLCNFFYFLSLPSGISTDKWTNRTFFLNFCHLHILSVLLVIVVKRLIRFLAKLKAIKFIDDKKRRVSPMKVIKILIKNPLEHKLINFLLLLTRKLSIQSMKSLNKEINNNNISTYTLMKLEWRRRRVKARWVNTCWFFVGVRNSTENDKDERKREKTIFFHSLIKVYESHGNSYE